MRQAFSVHLFCQVVDNYGDIGVCWRLARQLLGEHGSPVTLWLDDLSSLSHMCEGVDVNTSIQHVQGVQVRRWSQDFPRISPNDLPDIVVEGFGCRLPDTYLHAMAAAGSRVRAWINLEYLSAEEWVQGCHKLPSPNPSLPITRHFFFPGFAPGTGGLLREVDLEQQRRKFLADPALQVSFMARLGVRQPKPQSGMQVSLFCYRHADVEGLFKAWRTGSTPVRCLVPAGVAPEAVAAFLDGPGETSAHRTRDALTVQVIPFVEQPDYDRLLWGCDLNFVRGEDSFVRAIWACKPFTWQIYHQDENAHLAKLDAFLQLYLSDTDDPRQVAAVRAWFLAWNGSGSPNGCGLASAWAAYSAVLPSLQQHGERLAQRLLAHGDLAGNLLRFVQESC